MTDLPVMAVDEFVPTGTSEIMIKCNRLKYRSIQEWRGAARVLHESACCVHAPRRQSQKGAPSTQKPNAKHTKGESENVNSLPRGQPPKGAQNTRLKTTRFQKSQYGTHLTSKFGETIRRIFRARNPIHILKLPFLQGLLNSQEK